MKLLVIPIFAPLLIAACVPLPQQCGPTEAVVIGESKTGVLIYDDLPLLPPCDVLRTNTPEQPLPPVSEPPVTPEPPIDPPVVEPPTTPKPENPCVGNPGNAKCVGKAGEKGFEDDEGDVRGNGN